MTAMKVSIDRLINALGASWTKDSCFDASKWSPDNPARGQCVASSLVVQDYLGGDLRRYDVTLPGGSHEKHYCNVLEDGTEVDTTRKQYTFPVTLSIDPVNLKSYRTVREKRLAEEETRKKYERLRDRVSAYLSMKV